MYNQSINRKTIGIKVQKKIYTTILALINNNLDKILIPTMAAIGCGVYELTNVKPGTYQPQGIIADYFFYLALSILSIIKYLPLGTSFNCIYKICTHSYNLISYFKNQWQSMRTHEIFTTALGISLWYEICKKIKPELVDIFSSNNNAEIHRRLPEMLALLNIFSFIAIAGRLSSKLFRFILEKAEDEIIPNKGALKMQHITPQNYSERIILFMLRDKIKRARLKSRDNEKTNGTTAAVTYHNQKTHQTNSPHTQRVQTSYGLDPILEVQDEGDEEEKGRDVLHSRHNL